VPSIVEIELWLDTPEPELLHTMSTVQFNFSFYLEYLARWPEYCQMAVGQENMGYGMHCWRL
jgi:hypothetical protein